MLFSHIEICKEKAAHEYEKGKRYQAHAPPPSSIGMIITAIIVYFKSDILNI
jgi:hypothetical protein